MKPEIVDVLVSRNMTLDVSLYLQGFINMGLSFLKDLLDSIHYSNSEFGSDKVGLPFISGNHIWNVLKTVIT